MARPEQPLAYGPTGRWQAGQDNVTWDFTGTESAKFGLSNAASTGRAASISPGSHGQLEMIVRDFEVRRDCAYADHPFGTPRNDQIFQAWDGFGFGELEVRSPALDASRQRTLVDESSIWIFAGPEAAVREIGRSLLAPNALPLASTSN